jgi:hypothetical protein
MHVAVTFALQPAMHIDKHKSHSGRMNNRKSHVADIRLIERNILPPYCGECNDFKTHSQSEMFSIHSLW